MLPPVLEIYVVWHPDDVAGQAVATDFIEHFHGNRFSGLLGGAIEVYTRSQGWRDANDAPRRIPLPDTAAETGLVPAEFVAIVPVIGNELAFATSTKESPWTGYLSELVKAAGKPESRIGMFPVLLDEGAARDNWIGKLLGSLQLLARPYPAASVVSPPRSSKQWVWTIFRGSHPREAHRRRTRGSSKEVGGSKRWRQRRAGAAYGTGSPMRKTKAWQRLVAPARWRPW